jgi:hypothetical protein
MKHDAPISALIDQLIATLLAVFGVSAAIALRVLACVAKPARFARALRAFRHRNWTVRLDGESDAVVEARLKHIAWIADDPVRACRHLARQARGWDAYRYAQWGLTPRAVVRVLGDAPADPSLFGSPRPDTS